MALTEFAQLHIDITFLLHYSSPSVILGTPNASGRETSMWNFTSPDGSRVERYIVEFECRVRSITFVEKYTSVSLSGGTGRVATSVSCFGGLGQLYRVKVWAVSGPNISRALACITPDKQCREEGRSYSRPCSTSLCGMVNMHNIYQYIVITVH